MAAYEQQRKACYQKFAVTPCLTEARDSHNEALRDLKRQETLLNDAKRKTKSAQRVKAIEERNSPQALQQQAEQRGRALEQEKNRAASREQEQIKRDAQAAKPSAAPRVSPIAPPAPTGKPRAQPVPKLPVAQRPAQIERSAKSQQAAAKRDKDFAERRAKATKREAERKKPAAASLPTPK